MYNKRARQYQNGRQVLGKAQTSLIAKRNDRHNASNSAIAGAGAVTAGAGLAGGGIPGFRSDSETIRNVRQGNWKRRTGAALSSGRGGVFGYRIDAHQGALDRFSNDKKYFADKPASRPESFMRGRGAGKIKPEVDIIRHLKIGRRASGVALLGGAAATTYGVHQARSQKLRKAEESIQRYNGALAGAGGGAAALSIGGEKILRRQGRKWSAREADSRRQAAKIIPNLKNVDDNEARKNPRILAGKSKVQAEAAGGHRGAAAQEKYFSHVYNVSARYARKIRNPALATAAVGGGGLLLARPHRQTKSAALYERDKQTSPIRLTGTLAGLGLAGWGAPRLRMLGPALARGVKAAEAHDSAAAAEALRRAEQAAGALRAGTGHAEARMRQLSYVDAAVNKVPRSIRPEVATAAGVILIAQSHPVRRTSYRPVTMAPAQNGW
jgi:hypothetical protein